MKSAILSATIAFTSISAASAQAPRATIIVGVRQLGPVGYRDPIGAISPDGRWRAYAVDAHLYVRPMQIGSSFELGAPENVRLRQDAARVVAGREMDRLHALGVPRRFPGRADGAFTLTRHPPTT